MVVRASAGAEVAIASAAARDATAIQWRIITPPSEHFTNRHLIVALAEQNRLPAIYGYREHAKVGGLMAYAWNFVGLARHAANQIDRILRGTLPGDIPSYKSRKFDLVINLKTTKILGLTVPDSLLARADEVIE